MLKKVSLVMGALLLSSAASAQVHVGAGESSCGKWVAARRGKSTDDVVRRSLMMSWIQGYLVGVASGYAEGVFVGKMAVHVENGEMSMGDAAKVDRDSEQYLAWMKAKFKTVSGWEFDPPDSAAIESWMDKYCSANPLNSLRRASLALGDELNARAGLKE